MAIRIKRGAYLRMDEHAMHYLYLHGKAIHSRPCQPLFRLDKRHTNLAFCAIYINAPEEPRERRPPEIHSHLLRQHQYQINDKMRKSFVSYFPSPLHDSSNNKNSVIQRQLQWRRRLEAVRRGQETCREVRIAPLIYTYIATPLWHHSNDGY